MLACHLHQINNSKVCYGYDWKLRGKGGRKVNGKGRVEIRR